MNDPILGTILIMIIGLVGGAFILFCGWALSIPIWEECGKCETPLVNYPRP